VRERSDIRLVSAEQMLAAAPQTAATFTLRAKLPHRGVMRQVAVIPDLVFGLDLADGTRRNFMVEIDRGTMPIRRSDLDQTSFESKLRVYLAAHAGKQHERHFGWKNFRVLVVTTDEHRIRSMTEAFHRLRLPRGTGPSLFLFATFDDLRATDPLAHDWKDGYARQVIL
jgi:hypothetical protein